jgi:HSP20 family protein
MALVATRTRMPELFGFHDGGVLENLLRQMAPMTEPLPAGQWMPSVEIVESEAEFLLTAELPGVKPEEVEVDVHDGVLTLKGEKKEEIEKKEKRYQVWERTYGAFERSFTLSPAVDVGGIKADFEHGVLKVHLPKTKESKGRKIEIKTV